MDGSAPLDERVGIAPRHLARETEHEAASVNHCRPRAPAGTGRVRPRLSVVVGFEINRGPRRVMGSP